MDNNITIGGGNNSKIYPRSQINPPQSINVGFEYLRYGMKVIIIYSLQYQIAKDILGSLTEFENIKICFCSY